MPVWISGEVIFYTGIGLMIAAAIGAIVSALILGTAKKKLNKRLDAEYGCRKR